MGLKFRTVLTTRIARIKETPLNTAWFRRLVYYVKKVSPKELKNETSFKARVVLSTLRTELVHDTQHRNADTQHRNADTQHRNADTQHRNADTQHRNADTQHRNADTQHRNAQATEPALHSVIFP